MTSGSSEQPTVAGARLFERARGGIHRYGWQTFTKEATLRLLRPALAPVAARRLRRFAGRIDGIDGVMDLTFDFDAFGIEIRPCQARWEFRQLLAEVLKIRPRAMLEIGTATGGSLFALAQMCAPDAHIISIDLPRGRFGGGYPRWKIPLYKSFASATQQLDLIRADSHEPATAARVNELLAGRMLDLLFIDGDHSYDGVRQDFEAYKPLVRPGGLIAFHDIAPPRAEARAPGEDGAVVDDDGIAYLVGEVPQFWRELSAQHGGREFVDPDGSGCFGIGLIHA